MDSIGQLSRGDWILAKSMDGPVKRIVWEDCGDSVLVCSERQYEALSKGWSAPMEMVAICDHLVALDATESEHKIGDRRAC